MKKSKKSVNKSAEHNFEEMLIEDLNKVDDIPLDWLPKKEPITETMSYKNND